MKLPAGSIPWLLAHDLRLDWRRRAAARGSRRWLALALTLGTPLFLALAVGVPLGLVLNRFGPPTGPTAALVAAATLASAFLFMLSQSLAEVVDALYERSDLDLLFSSPIRPGRVIVVRALGVAFAAFSVFGFFSCGPLVAIALMGRPQWLATLPLLYACALAATGVAMVLGSVLVALVGPRRTRFLGRALSVAFGSAFFLATQVFALIGPPSAGPRGGAWIARFSEQVSGPADVALRAFAGEPAPFLLLTGVFLVLFALAVGAVGPRFAALHATAQGATASRPAPPGRPKAFRQGRFAAILVKELRLLLRDPLLAPQVLLRVVYLAPAAILVVRYGAQLQFTALTGAVAALTLMANQLAGSLAWLTISAEDAPDLLASSPVARPLALRVKLAAAFSVVMGIVSLAVVPLAFVAPYQAVVVFAGCAAAALAAGLVNLWWQRPGKRSAFRKRAPAPWFVTLAELALGLLMASATALLSTHQVAGLVPAFAAVLVLIALRLPARP